MATQGQHDSTDQDEQQRESGVPGGGQGRRDEVGGSGVYPASGPWPEGNAELQGMASWGQGEQGAAGYEESGRSELWFTDAERTGGGQTGGGAQASQGQSGPGRRNTQSQARTGMQGGQGQTCRDIMTQDVTCCLASDTVDQVAQAMKTENVGSIPIVENQQSKRLIGIVTDRDLALQVVAEERDPRSTPVEQVMSGNLVTCHPDDPMQQAMQLMGDHQLRRLPVVDNQGSIVGIIAQADLATRADQPRQVAEVVEEISQPNGSKK